MLDLAAIKAAAQAATPGEWVWDRESGALAAGHNYVIWLANAICSNPETDAQMLGALGSSTEGAATQNMAHIAAANPAAVLELIERLECAEATTVIVYDPHGGCAEHPATEAVAHQVKMLRDERDVLMREIATLRAQAGAVRFAGHVLKAHRNEGYPGDVDGGYLQRRATECGLLEERTMSAPCGEQCACAEVLSDEEFPTVCYFNTEAGKAAMRAAEDPPC